MSKLLECNKWIPKGLLMVDVKINSLKTRLANHAIQRLSVVDVLLQNPFLSLLCILCMLHRICISSIITGTKRRQDSTPPSIEVALQFWVQQFRSIKCNITCRLPTIQSILNDFCNSLTTTLMRQLIIINGQSWISIYLIRYKHPVLIDWPQMT